MIILQPLTSRITPSSCNAPSTSIYTTTLESGNVLSTRSSQLIISNPPLTLLIPSPKHSKHRSFPSLLNNSGVLFERDWESVGTYESTKPFFWLSFFLGSYLLPAISYIHIGDSSVVIFISYHVISPRISLTCSSFWHAYISDNPSGWSSSFLVISSYFWIRVLAEVYQYLEQSYLPWDLQ